MLRSMDFILPYEATEEYFWDQKYDLKYDYFS